MFYHIKTSVVDFKGNAEPIVNVAHALLAPQEFTKNGNPVPVFCCLFHDGQASIHFKNEYVNVKFKMPYLTNYVESFIEILSDFGCPNFEVDVLEELNVISRLRGDIKLIIDALPSIHLLLRNMAYRTKHIWLGKFYNAKEKKYFVSKNFTSKKALEHCFSHVEEGNDHFVVHECNFHEETISEI